MFWRPTEALIEPRILYHSTTTATGTSHSFVYKVAEGRYTLHSACAVTNETVPFRCTLFIYSLDTRHYIIRESQVINSRFMFNLPRTIDFEGPAYIQWSATTTTTDTMTFTIGLEKVKSQ